jgi:hypothetical protein
MTLPIAFPVVAFIPDSGKGAEPGLESVEGHYRPLPYLWLSTVREGFLRNAILVDSSEKVWRITGLVDLGPTNPIRRLIPFLRGDGRHRIQYEVVEEPPIPFPEVVERVCASMWANLDDWRDDEAIAGENGKPKDETKMMERRVARVRKTKSIKKLADLLDRL